MKQNLSPVNIARGFESEIKGKKGFRYFAKCNMLQNKYVDAPPHLTFQVSLPPSWQSQPAQNRLQQK